MQQVLEASGYTVLAARHGEEAMRLGDEHAGRRHLLVTDVVLPGMSGREIARRLAAQHPGMHVLYMSGYTEAAIMRHGGLEAGMALLQKPFTPDALARKVRQVLDAPRGE